MLPRVYYTLDATCVVCIFNCACVKIDITINIGALLPFKIKPRV